MIESIEDKFSSYNIKVNMKFVFVISVYDEIEINLS